MQYIFWTYKLIYKEMRESNHFYCWTHNHTACDNKPLPLLCIRETKEDAQNHGQLISIQMTVLPCLNSLSTTFPLTDGTVYWRPPSILLSYFSPFSYHLSHAFSVLFFKCQKRLTYNLMLNFLNIIA